MKAVLVDANAPGHLVLGEAPEPQPDSNEVVIAVRAVSLNRGEVRRAQSAPPGRMIGWDLAGVVEQPARDGSGPPQGTRVVGFSAAMRGWAERCAVPARSLAALPDAVSFEDAATLPVAGLTALYGLERGERLLASRVLITGASGGAGWFACGLARLMGATVVAHVRREDQVAGAHEAGAHEVVAHPDGDGLETHGPYRLILDGVGGPLVSRLITMLDTDGRCILYGVTAGTEASLSVRHMMDTGMGRVEGFRLYRDADFKAAGKGLARLAILVADDRLRPQISVREDWSRVGTVAEALLERRYPGKAVLTVG